MRAIATSLTSSPPSLIAEAALQSRQGVIVASNLRKRGPQMVKRLGYDKASRGCHPLAQGDGAICDRERFVEFDVGGQDVAEVEKRCNNVRMLRAEMASLMRSARLASTSVSS